MNKILITTIIATSIVTVATIVVMKKDKDIKNIQVSEQNISCAEMCGKTIPNLCSDIDKVGYDFQNNCEANCMDWSDGLRSCITKAKSCDQLDLDFSRNAEDIFREYNGKTPTDAEKIQQKSHCTIIDDDYSKITENVKEKETQFGCSSACYKYKQCAGFGEGVGEKGKNEAYDTCFEQCQNWSKKTLSCMKKVQINSPMDCAPLTACGLSEYQNQGF